MLNSPTMRRSMKGSLRINPILANGIATEQGKDIPAYMDKVMLCMAATLPEGLVYTGSRAASPIEQLLVISKERSKGGGITRRMVDLGKSDCYLRAYEFELFGEKLPPRYIFLPYIRRGGIIRIRDSTYAVSPVLADNLISAYSDKIYMPVTRSKSLYYGLMHTFSKDGAITPCNVVYSAIHWVGKNAVNTKRETCLVHYLLCKYGLKESLKRYYNLEVVIGKADINTQYYPENEWVICASTQRNPDIRSKLQYTPIEIRVAIRREEFTPHVESFIGGMFYVMDHESTSIVIEDLNDTYLWRRLLSRFLLRSVPNETKAMNEINTHMESLDAYVDLLVTERIRKAGLDYTNIYDLFNHLICNYDDLTNNSRASYMADKQVETVRFIMFDVVTHIFDLLFKLTKLKGERLNSKMVNQLFGKTFPTDVIFKIGNGKSHGEVSIVSNATDLLPISVTKKLIPQKKVTVTGKRYKSTEVDDESKELDGSQAYVTTATLLSNSDPTGREYINHYMELNDDLTIKLSEAELEDIDELNRLFKGE